MLLIISFSFPMYIIQIIIHLEYDKTDMHPAQEMGVRRNKATHCRTNADKEKRKRVPAGGVYGTQINYLDGTKQRVYTTYGPHKGIEADITHQHKGKKL
uniref:Pco115388 n=1 Tax=Arundo donax TaxID=35708 RepID=A0A0A9H2M8_ARUDO